MTTRYWWLDDDADPPAAVCAVCGSELAADGTCDACGGQGVCWNCGHPWRMHQNLAACWAKLSDRPGDYCMCEALPK